MERRVLGVCARMWRASLPPQRAARKAPQVGDCPRLTWRDKARRCRSRRADSCVSAQLPHRCSSNSHSDRLKSVQWQLSGAPGARDWHVLPLLPNMMLPAPLVYRVPSVPQHPARSQLVTWGKFPAGETVLLGSLLLEMLPPKMVLPGALGLAAATDPLATKSAASR